MEGVFKASPRLAHAANVAVHEALAIKKGEHVLIITNPIDDVYRISQALYSACIKTKASPTLIVQPKKLPLDNAEPSVINAMKSEPEVIISISAVKLGKDKEAIAKPYSGLDGKPYDHIFDQLIYGLKKTRSFWSPEITLDMFLRTVPIDYETLRENCAKVEDRFRGAKVVRVHTDEGTDIKIGIEGRETKNDNGDFRYPGKGGNLPAGEVFISPALGKSNGVIVFDGSITIDGTLIVRKPVKVTVKKGHITKVEGEEEATKLRNYVHAAVERPYMMAKQGEITLRKAKEYSRNATNLGELGIGLNPKARIIGNVLEDEKVLGTVHFAIGSNYDQDALALIHSDCLVKNPTLMIDHETIMQKGKMLI